MNVLPPLLSAASSVPPALPIETPSPATSSLDRYRTYNFIPCVERRGLHGGSLITVRIDPEFNLLDASLDAQKYFTWEKKEADKRRLYEQELVAYTRQKQLFPDRFIMAPFYGEPSKCMQAFMQDLHNSFETRKRFPSYSDNPESAGNPQGDINWLRFLPQEVQHLFGFAKQDDCYTFPDVAAMNGVREEFNRTAASLGLGDNYIPFSLVEVDGSISDDTFLELVANGFLPVARPKTKTSWFYHDLLYHVIGMLLTPRQSLLSAIALAKFARQSTTLTEKGRKILGKILDSNTTYSLRIRAMEYLRSQATVDFYIFNELLSSGPSLYFCEIIVQFAFLSIFGSNAYTSETAQKLFEEMETKKYFFADYREIIRQCNYQNLVRWLTLDVKAHLDLMVQICLAAEGRGPIKA